MLPKEPNREELEHEAAEAIARQEEASKYVERPKSHRVLAWILVVLVIIGVFLSYAWISGLLR